MIKYLIENLAIRTYIVGNLGDKGLNHMKNTMKFVWSAIAGKIDQQVNFQPHYETEEDSEGVFICENLNFNPEEWGFEMHEEQPEPEQIEEEGEGAEGDQEPEADKGKDKAGKDKKKVDEDNKEEQEAEGENQGEGEGGEGDEEPEEEQEPPLTFKEIEIFKNKLAKLGEVYVNDALDASLTHSNTVADLRTENKVMGIRMTEEVRKLGMFFKYEYSPTVCILGGAFKSVSIYDRLLLFNSLLRCTDVIVVLGSFSLYFLKALGIKLGPQDKLVDEKYCTFCIDMLKKAHELGIKVILPTDFVTLSKPKVGNEEQNEGEGGNEEAQPADGAENEEAPKENEQTNTIEAVGEVNWIDLIYDEGKQTADFSTFIDKKIEELLNPPVEMEEEPAEPKEGEGEQDAEAPQEDEAKDQEEAEGEGAAKPKTPEPPHEFESKAFILEFGQNTVQKVLECTKDAMKIFWDGSVSLYPDTFAHENNKTFTLDLLRIRAENEERTEPKYSLIHSEETDLIVNQSMSKIKLDEMDNKNTDGSMGGGYDESGSMTSTFQQDNQSPAIFVCAEGQFTLKLLQGIENRCLLNMDEHPALTQEQIEDDLSILDEI